MSRSLLNDAREQAARAEPAVKGPALLHIARVLATLDPAEAEKALAEGLSVIVALPDDAREVLI